MFGLLTVALASLTERAPQHTDNTCTFQGHVTDIQLGLPSSPAPCLSGECTGAGNGGREMGEAAGRQGHHDGHETVTPNADGSKTEEAAGHTFAMTLDRGGEVVVIGVAAVRDLQERAPPRDDYPVTAASSSRLSSSSS